MGLLALLAATRTYRQRLSRLCSLPYNVGGALGSSSRPEINLGDLCRAPGQSHWARTHMWQDILGLRVGSVNMPPLHLGRP